MKKYSKVALIMLVLALAFCLAACGSAGATDNYTCTSVSYAGFDMAADDIFEEPVTLSLSENGSGSIVLEGTEASVKWTLDGTTLTLTIEGEDSVGTLEDGVITVDLFGVGTEYTFVLDGADGAAEGEDVEE